MRQSDGGEIAGYLARERARMPRSVRQLLVLAAYRRHLVSAGRAAELMDLPLEEFLHFASREGITVFDQTPDELAEDLRNA